LKLENGSAENSKLKTQNCSDAENSKLKTQNCSVTDDADKRSDGRGEFVTARQLAEVLQVSESTVRKLARAGRIPSVRLTPRLTRYNLQTVLRALDGDGAAHKSRVRRNANDNDQQLSFEDVM
jgi:excisionase family DNA binding protein